MKKTLALTLPLLAMFLFGGLLSNDGEVGQVIYDKSMAIESSVAGLEAKTADIGEMNIAYYINDNPTKPTIVMLHGYSSNKNIWNRLAKYFTDDYQVVVPDLAGHDHTPFEQAWSYSIPARAERVVALLDELGIQQAHFIGNRMGGVLA